MQCVMWPCARRRSKPTPPPPWVASVSSCTAGCIVSCGHAPLARARRAVAAPRPRHLGWSVRWQQHVVPGATREDPRRVADAVPRAQRLRLTVSIRCALASSGAGQLLRLPGSCQLLRLLNTVYLLRLPVGVRLLRFPSAAQLLYALALLPCRRRSVRAVLAQKVPELEEARRFEVAVAFWDDAHREVFARRRLGGARRPAVGGAGGAVCTGAAMRRGGSV
eukprot:364308-Chlamydomonas_euryale.AAC.4